MSREYVMQEEEIQEEIQEDVDDNESEDMQ